MDSAPEQSPEHWLGNPQRHTYYGIYKGVVVQRTDPSRRGRMRVRVVDLHSNSIAVENIPWALPKTPSWAQGGMMAIPPLDATVWVEFEAGNPEYPIWSGGWWGENETPHGPGRMPDWFGGDARNGILRLDHGVQPDDAPNCYGINTPLHKHLLLDDRGGLERIRLGDQLDNTIWTNSEVGVLTVETVRGTRISDVRERGITLSRRDEQVQIYTHYGWRMTFDDRQRVFEISAPSGAKVRISDASGGRSIRAWTADGHYISMDDAVHHVDIATHGGQRLLLDQAAQVVHLTDGASMLHMEPGHVIIDVIGKLDVRASGGMDFVAGGKGRFEATQLHWNSEATAITNGGVSSSAPANPAQIPLTTRAWDASRLRGSGGGAAGATPVST